MSNASFFLTLRLEKGFNLVHEDLYARQPDGSFSIVPNEIDVQPVIGGPVRKTLMFEIEALRFYGTRESGDAILEWFDGNGGWGEGWEDEDGERLYLRVTDDNNDYMRPGDWLVRGYDPQWDYCFMTNTEFQDLGSGA